MKDGKDMKDWSIFWNALAGIGSIAGAIFTPIAIIISLKQYTTQLKKILKISFDVIYGCDGEYVEILIYNLGLRTVYLSRIMLQEKNYFELYNPPTCWTGINSKLNIDFPIELKPEESVHLKVKMNDLIDVISSFIFNGNRPYKCRICLEENNGERFICKETLVIDQSVDTIMKLFSYQRSNNKNKHSKCKKCYRANSNPYYRCIDANSNKKNCKNFRPKENNNDN